MDFKNILNEIEKADPEVYEKLSPRRHILKSFGSKVAVAAIPFALGSLFKKAYGKTNDTATVVSVLNYALTLELLEYNFYYQGLNGSGSSNIVVPSGDPNNISEIRNHEQEHVVFLKGVISSIGTVAPSLHHYSGTDINPDSFNFTNVTLGSASGVNIFADYDTFLAFAQVFEDTGVRAYKGAAPSLQGSTINNSTTNPYLTAALQIHSVEGRHASHIRAVRRVRSGSGSAYGAIKPWITSTQTYIDAVNASANYGAGNSSSYPAEDNTVQGGVNITTLSGVNGNVTANVATESFDEPLDSTTVVNLVTPFIAS